MTHTFPYKEKIYNSVIIQEITGRGKPKRWPFISSVMKFELAQCV